MKTKAAAIAFCVLVLAYAATPQSPSQSSAQLLLSQQLPPMDGAHLTVKLVDVTYPVGAASSPHSHPCPVIGYVVAGTIQSQVKGDPEGSYPAGKVFYEPPNGVHVVSKNGSQTQPSKLLVIFICDHDVPLSHPVETTH